MKREDPELWDERLNWLLNHRDADCGFRSNMGAVVAAVERGNASIGGSPDKYDGRQTEVGPSASGAFTRDRSLWRKWLRLDNDSKDVICWHYTGSAQTGLASGERSAGRWPLHVESQLDNLAGVAWQQAIQENRAALLLDACEFRRTTLLDPIRQAAEKRVREAHRAWCLVADQDEPDEPGEYASDAASAEFDAARVASYDAYMNRKDPEIQKDSD